MSLLNIQIRTLEDSDAQNQLVAFRSRVSALALTEELCTGTTDGATIPTSNYARRLFEEISQVYQTQGRVTADFCGMAPVIGRERCVPFGLILNELMANALRHGFPDGRTGRLVVRIDGEGNEIVLTVADDGVGYPPDFDWETSSALGFQLIRQLCNQLGGTCTFFTTLKSTVEVRFPVA